MNVKIKRKTKRPPFFTLGEIYGDASLMTGVFVPNSQSPTSFLLALVSSFGLLLTPRFDRAHNVKHGLA
jgi:hypothetical protein